MAGAVVTKGLLTLADISSTMVDGEMSKIIIDTLISGRPILADLPLSEANTIEGDVSTLLSRVPEGTWRGLNQGVQAEKVEYIQVRETMALLSSFSNVDDETLTKQPNPNLYRLRQDFGFMKGMSQKIERALLYSNNIVPNEFLGFAPRYNKLYDKTNDGLPGSPNVIDGGGTGSDNTSIWLIKWGGLNGPVGIYPKGAPSGFKRIDQGKGTMVDSNQGRFLGWETFFMWRIGLKVPNWKFVVRIANIPRSKLEMDKLPAGEQGWLNRLIIRAINRLCDGEEDTDGANVSFYCNNLVKTALDIQNSEKPNLLLKMTEIGGVHRLTYRGIPIKVCSSIKQEEARVTK